MMGSDKFDIEATGETKTGDSEFPQMMRALMADRFQLKFHRETRTLSIYELVTTEDGPKFNHSAETATGGTRRSGVQRTI